MYTGIRFVFSHQTFYAAFHFESEWHSLFPTNTHFKWYASADTSHSIRAKNNFLQALLSMKWSLVIIPTSSCTHYQSAYFCIRLLLRDERSTIKLARQHTARKVTFQDEVGAPIDQVSFLMLLEWLDLLHR